MAKKNRWVLLEHMKSPNDPSGRHFDLLLEDGVECRSWRLDKIPTLDGQLLKAVQISAHKLEWLEIEGRFVSGGRGWAQPIKKGFFLGSLPADLAAPIDVELHGSDLVGILAIRNGLCNLRSSL